MTAPQPLPHQPYVDAVLRAVGEAGYPAGPDSFTDYDTSDGQLLWLEAFIDLSVAGQDDADDPEDFLRAGLAWKQTTGWLFGDYNGQGRYEHIQQVFDPGTVLPTPAVVAEAVRQLLTGAAELPWPDADDTMPAGGALPAVVQGALEAGDITAELAVRLATYWPTA